MLHGAALHTYFDVTAWLVAALSGWLLLRLGWVKRQSAHYDIAYFTTISVTAMLGAIALGTLNLQLSGGYGIARSIMGALVGSIIGIEIYKRCNGIAQSTGILFVVPLITGIVIGRIGCALSGLDDHTYGIATSLPWGVDHGDGIYRHPVALYESLAMLTVLPVFVLGLQRGWLWLPRYGFYVFAFYYGLQRFGWEFLKPYAPLVGSLNLFHIVAMGLMGYSLMMIRVSRVHASR